MNLNKLYRLPILGAIMTLLSSLGVMAEPFQQLCKNYLSGNGGVFTKLVAGVFCGLLEFIGKMAGATGSAAISLGFMRLLLFVIILVIGYKLIRYTSLGVPSSLVLAVILGLIGAVFTPQAILAAAMANYTLLMASLFLILPIALGIAALFVFKKSPWIQFGIALIMTYSWWFVGDVFKKGTSAATNGVGYKVFGGMSYGLWTFVFVVMLGITIVSLIRGLMSFGGGNSHRPNKVGHLVKKAGDWFAANNVPGTAAYQMKQTELNNVARGLDDLEKDGTVDASIGVIHSHVTGLADLLNALAGSNVDKFGNADQARLDEAVTKAEEALTAAHSEINKVARKEAKEIRAAKGKFKALTGKNLNVEPMLETISENAALVKSVIRESAGLINAAKGLNIENKRPDALENIAARARKVSGDLVSAVAAEEQIGRAAGEVRDMITRG